MLPCSVRNDSVQWPDCWVRTRTVTARESRHYCYIIIIIIIITITIIYCSLFYLVFLPYTDLCVCLCVCVCMYACRLVCHIYDNYVIWQPLVATFFLFFLRIHVAHSDDRPHARWGRGRKQQMILAK